jgi:hypothetical protein
MCLKKLKWNDSKTWNDTDKWKNVYISNFIYIILGSLIVGIIILLTIM